MKVLSRNMIIGYDVTDPTTWETITDEETEEAHEILDGRVCPICGKPLMSDENLVCASLPGDYQDKFQQIMHDECVSDEFAELLEKLGYSICEGTGEEFE